MAEANATGVNAKEPTARVVSAKLDLLLDAANHLEEVQKEHGDILFHLEQRPITDLRGIERRLDEVTDTLERIVTPYVEQPVRLRPWWLTPGLVTLAVLAGFVLGLVWGHWAQTHRGPLVWPGAIQQSVPATKGKK